MLVQVLQKKTIYNTLIFFIGVIINIIALLILVPIIKLYGVPISLLISYLSIGIISWIISEKLYYIGFHKVYFFVLITITTGLIIILSLFNISLIAKLIITVIAIIVILKFLTRIQNLKDFN